jgi:hypothetical protein
VSVSVFAPEADLASRNSVSSISRVFFIHAILPYVYGKRGKTNHLLFLGAPSIDAGNAHAEMEAMRKLRSRNLRSVE